MSIFFVSKFFFQNLTVFKNYSCINFISIWFNPTIFFKARLCALFLCLLSLWVKFSQILINIMLINAFHCNKLDEVKNFVIKFRSVQNRIKCMKPAMEWIQRLSSNKIKLRRDRRGKSSQRIQQIEIKLSFFQLKNVA